MAAPANGEFVSPGVTGGKVEPEIVGSYTLAVVTGLARGNNLQIRVKHSGV